MGVVLYDKTTYNKVNHYTLFPLHPPLMNLESPAAIYIRKEIVMCTYTILYYTVLYYTVLYYIVGSIHLSLSLSLDIYIYIYIYIHALQGIFKLFVGPAACRNVTTDEMNLRSNDDRPQRHNQGSVR